MAKSGSGRGVMVLGAVGLVGLGCLLGAAASADSARDGATLVGITSYGEDGDRLVRMWSDGRCEVNGVFRGAPPSFVQGWQEIGGR